MQPDVVIASRGGDSGGGHHDLPSIGIVVLNWNRSDLVAACIDSIIRSGYPRATIVVVDNGSTDGSAARLKATYPFITLIENGRNLGFAAGNNAGIRWLVDQAVDAIMLLNDDTEIEPTMLATLARSLDATADIGIVGPKIYYHGTERQIWFAGGDVDRLGQASHPHADEIDRVTDTTPRDVDYISGCALLVRTDIVRQVGMLDERFFAYYEETEFCARVRAHGYRVVLVPSATMWHKVKPGDRSSSPLYLYLMARNRLLYLRCTGASAVIIATAVMVTLRTVTSWLLRPRHQARRRFAPVVLRAVIDFLRMSFGPPPAAVTTARRG